MELVAYSVALFIALILPVYCVRQEPSWPFFKGYLWGGVLGAIPGFLLAALGGSGPEAVGAMVLALVGGAIWGAYVGVALAGLLVGPIPRQVGTQWGAAAGLGVALLLWAVLPWLLPHERLFDYEQVGEAVVLFVFVAPFLMALGGMIGAQLGLWRSADRGSRGLRRERLRVDLLLVAAVLGVSVVVPLGFGYLHKLEVKRQSERFAREAKAREVEERFPTGSQALRQLRSGNPTERASAAQILGNPLTAGADERVIPALVKATRDDNAGVRGVAAQSLGSLRAWQVMQQRGGPDDQRVVDALARLLRDSDPSVRLQAVLALGQVGSPRVVALLKEAANDPNPKVRAAATAMAGQFRGRPAPRSR